MYFSQRRVPLLVVFLCDFILQECHCGCAYPVFRYWGTDIICFAIELSPHWTAVPVTALLNNDYSDSKRFLLSHTVKVITVAKSYLTLSVSSSDMIIWYPSIPKVLPSIINQRSCWFIKWLFFFFFFFDQVVQWAFIHTSFCDVPEYRFFPSVRTSIHSTLHPSVHPHYCMVIHPSISSPVKQIRLTPALSVLAKFHQSIITLEWNVVIAILWKWRKTFKSTWNFVCNVFVKCRAVTAGFEFIRAPVSVLSRHVSRLVTAVF